MPFFPKTGPIWFHCQLFLGTKICVSGWVYSIAGYSWINFKIKVFCGNVCVENVEEADNNKLQEVVQDVESFRCLG